MQKVYGGQNVAALDKTAADAKTPFAEWRTKPLARLTAEQWHSLMLLAPHVAGTSGISVRFE